MAACYDKSRGFVTEREREGLDVMRHMNTPFSYGKVKLGYGFGVEVRRLRFWDEVL